MSYVEFWKSFFSIEERDASASGEIAVNCPFHPWNVGKDDDNPSMHVNLETGKYKCFSCPEDISSSTTASYTYSNGSGTVAASQATGVAAMGGPILRAAGDAEAFVMAYYDVRFPTAKAIVSLLYGGEDEIPFPVSEEEILSWQGALANATNVKEILTENKGLDPNTLRLYEIGWDGHRVTIPVRNYRGDAVNVRRYDVGLKRKKGEKADAKMVSLAPVEFKLDATDTKDGPQVHVIRYGEPRLFPSPSLLPPLAVSKGTSHAVPVFLMAGEWDCILARQWKLDAFTFTGGEGTWKEAWNPTFFGREVYVCYDADKAGKSAAQRVAGSLHASGVKVRVVHLPLSGDKAINDKDFTDWLLKANPSSEREVREGITSFARDYTVPSVTKDAHVKADAEIREVSLLDASYDPEWQGRKTRLRAMVTGKDLTPYTVVRNAEITCDKMDADNPLCKGCAVNFAAGRLDVEIGPNQDVLRLIKCSDEQAMGELRRIVGIPGKCPKWEIKVESSQNVEQVMISPEVQAGAFNSLDTEHTMQDAYYIYPPGAARLEANQTYEMEGVRTTEPWKQHVVHVVNSVKPVQDTVQAFAMNEKVRESLVRFKPHPGQSHAGKFDGIARLLTRDVTHIYGREDLVVGILLTYASVQQFYFQGQRVDNGLVETLVIGDTRTGKSETAFRLVTYFGVGDVVTGEATTFAGLVGGLQAGVDGHWVVTWGKIPQNNGKLLVIDEASGLHTNEIERMSGVRSSRVAELIKVRQARTNARTRLLWMSNPRAARPLRAYSHGIEAVPELIGKPEDVARFDLVLSCASGEVSDEIINQLVTPSRNGTAVGGTGATGVGALSTNGSYPASEEIGVGAVGTAGRVSEVSLRKDETSVLLTGMEAGPVRGDFRNLILWAWSRRISEIAFSEQATHAILAASLDMGRRYSSSIPIVEAANQRIKIARVAVAAAALSASATDETYETILVLPEHVEFARTFMDDAYSKPSLDYAGYSEREKEDERVAEASHAIMKGWAARNRGIAEVVSRNDTFRAKDLEEQMNAEPDFVKDAIQRLTKTRMIEHTPFGYRKTPAFIGIMKELKAEEGKDA